MQFWAVLPTKSQKLTYIQVGKCAINCHCHSLLSATIPNTTESKLLKLKAVKVPFL